MLNVLKKLFAKKYEKPKGILLYGSVQEVIQTHKMLEIQGFHVRLVAPPPEVRVGCDLAVDIDGYIMCKAGNMKITMDKKEHRIVNISGGGCPDIPYVAEQLYNVKIEEAKNPIDLGNSLCAYMLQIAFGALKDKAADK